MITLTFSNSTPPFLRSVCRAFIADFGTTADLERLQHAYDYADSDVEKAEIICCLKRMEQGKRNAFLARVEKDCDLTERAVKLVRSNSI
jgi:hypothetical protein